MNSTRGRLPRPLFWVLPFFMVGLITGPSLTARGSDPWPAAFAAAGLVVLWTIVKRRIGLIPLGLTFLLVGGSVSSTVFSPPDRPGHVIRYADQEGLVFGGLIVEAPRVARGRTRLVVAADEVLEPGGVPRPVAGRIYLTVLDDRPRVTQGDRVRFPVLLRRLHGFANPGGFDYERYMTGQGLWVSGFLGSPRLLIPVRGGEEGGLGWTLGRLRFQAARFLEQNVGEPALGLMKALLLGQADEVDAGLVEAFRRLGLAHLLAISGLHVGLIALAGYIVLRRLLLLKADNALRFNAPRLAALLALGPVLFYAGLAGGRPSTTRAALMVAVFLLATLLERRKDYLTALAVAAWVILLMSPGAVFTPSFQLSFAAVGAIILLAPRFQEVFFTRDEEERRPRSRLLTWALGLAFVSTAALLGTAPIAAWHFNRLPLLSLPANMIYTPLISMGVVPTGLAALALAPVLPWAAQGLLRLVEWFLWLVLPSLEAAASLPGVELLVPTPSPLFLVAFYLFVGAFFLARPWQRAALGAAAVAAAYVLLVLVSGLSEPRDPRLEVTFLDVGQGNAAHVHLPDGTEMVIDGGGFPVSDFDPGENVVAPYLWKRGLTRVDVLVLTHPQADHAEGLPFLAENFGPVEFWSNFTPSRNQAYQEMARLARERRMARPSLADLAEGRRFGPAQVTVLAPAPDYLSRPAIGDRRHHLNNYSLILKITLDRVSFLFPGDVEAAGEAEVVRRQGERLRADVLLAPHHGSAGSLSPAFLEAVRPKIVIISAGPYNRFKFPSPKILDRVKQAGGTILRTDRLGAVTIVTDGQGIRVESHRRGTIFNSLE
ncbi:MAG: DNA internalization-related competence protein ComEC/Rec2 [Thermodesulfobacteriota bacterium]